MKRPSALYQQEEQVLGKAYDTRIVRRLWRYVRPHRGLILLSFGLLLAVGAAQLAQPYLLKRAIDGAILADRMERLAPVAALFLAALAAELLFRFAQLYVLERTGQNVVLDIRGHVFRHLQTLPSSYFDRHPVGRLMTRVTTDVESLNEAFTSGLVLMLADLVKLAGIVGILLWMDWRMALVTFAILPPMLALSWFFRGRIRDAYRRVRTRVARLNAFLQEAVSGMRIVQMFGQEDRTHGEFTAVNGDHRQAELRAVAFDSAFSALVELMGALTLAAIVWAGGWRILGGGMTFGTLVAFIGYAEKFFRPLEELSQRYAVMQAAMASSERILQLLDTRPSIVSPARPVALPDRPHGEIVFENVSFAYEAGSPVLRNVSFRIAPGEEVAVVGWTGSGKSTLIKLLVRLYDVQEGSIRIDGIDIRDLDLRDLRRSVGIVLQDPFLFADTVAGNISLGDPRIPPERIRGAAAAVHADRFIDGLGAGYDEPVRERGSNLSVGEKQLLSFARAVAFDPAVLVLDEATSSVDPATEARIQEALQVVLRDRTSLVIAHRLATIRDADRILVLHHGRLAEEGSHAALMARPDGIYRSLHRLQFGG
ncbi:MAG: ABC transporter ATP-binding protein [Acidobacteriota bacterium]